MGWHGQAVLVRVFIIPFMLDDYNGQSWLVYSNLKMDA
ncbi:MAG: hypothetical protein BROFUL_03064 [Candidatus Brocadia fulgida]|uniref:Uncharacterized protein n=1 Tax=Candidatus Brocadia fulgida TaxID=380242 RepID=A0A0M2UUU1_9BACT|nr:MAG: hypothetical protein BROFUL_03064 [Candidatus Brocadia fulgida]